MSNNQIIAVILLIVGVVLLYYGFQSSQGLDDQISETFTGRLTESTTFLFIAGIVSSVLGIGLLLRK